MGEDIVLDPNNTMALVEPVEANDMMRDIEFRERQEHMQDMIVPANFDDTLPNADKNPMAASTRRSQATNV